MVWFRRRRRVRMAPFDRSALPEVQPATFEQMRDEGVLMAESAGRLTLKNRLIVDALRGDRPYDEARAEASARDVLLELVQEADEVAARVAREREIAATREGRSEHQHDYHRDDAANLRRRERVYAAVAAELWRLREDPQYVADFAASARDAAWADISGAIEQELDRRWPRFDEEIDYEAERPARLEGFVDDLQREIRRTEARRAVEAIPEY